MNQWLSLTGALLTEVHCTWHTFNVLLIYLTALLFLVTHTFLHTTTTTTQEIERERLWLLLRKALFFFGLQLHSGSLGVVLYTYIVLCTVYTVWENAVPGASDNNNGNSLFARKKAGGTSLYFTSFLRRNWSRKKAKEREIEAAIKLHWRLLLVCAVHPTTICWTISRARTKLLKRTKRDSHLSVSGKKRDRTRLTEREKEKMAWQDRNTTGNARFLVISLQIGIFLFPKL